MKNQWSNELFGRSFLLLNDTEKIVLNTYIHDVKNPEWRDIPGYEGLYQASTVGDIKSLNRLGRDGRIVKERILKTTLAGKGYKTVVLRKNGKSVREYVHRLVCLTFNKQTDQNRNVVNHKYGVKACNWYKNLEWVLYSENNQHAYDTKLKPKGEDFYNAKLTEAQVAEIRMNGKDGTFQSIADRYGVSKATIRDVLINRTWNMDKSSRDYPIGGVIPH